jgi:hypothetical protein
MIDACLPGVHVSARDVSVAQSRLYMPPLLQSVWFFCVLRVHGNKMCVFSLFLLFCFITLFTFSSRFVFNVCDFCVSVRVFMLASLYLF